MKKLVIRCVPVSVFFAGLLLRVISLLLVALLGFLAMDFTGEVDLTGRGATFACFLAGDPSSYSSG